MIRDYITIWPPFPQGKYSQPEPLTMHPPVKNQVTCYDRPDDPKLDASDGAPVVEQDGTVTENKDHTRQEFKDESDINYMLSKFGVTQPRNAPMYGTWDDSIDLQNALAAVEEARVGYRTLPEELRKKFGSMEELLSAVNRGDLVLKGEEPKTEAPPETKPNDPPLA